MIKSSCRDQAWATLLARAYLLLEVLLSLLELLFQRNQPGCHGGQERTVGCRWAVVGPWRALRRAQQPLHGAGATQQPVHGGIRPERGGAGAREGRAFVLANAAQIRHVEILVLRESFGFEIHEKKIFETKASYYVCQNGVSMAVDDNLAKLSLENSNQHAEM